ncbi:ABC transporter ATP-binding protein [Georgenia muralis]|uniref:ABC-2 type transport system ATP-binding protein n=1 Tax=Georgenia muralis TaxID=154117 RepID=A0A3N4ZK07_9MICO|nr:ABC transporter ATP-binding protein [Georgenia muralis]RPF26158.1 ABC-2 type transport system ATP-binding protein [Georgenia muralis]
MDRSGGRDRGAAVATHDLTKHYGAVVALDSLDLEVRAGEIFGFLGPNGAGKSTTIRLLLGLVRPTRGTATILGVPVDDVARAHRLVGYVPGDVALWPQLTGTETLELLGNVAGGVDAAFRDELLERLQLDPSPRVRSLSKGNRQKVALVAAMMTRPEVLLLDEPTAGLDPLMEAEFQLLAREAAARGQTLFLSSHILDEVQDLCDRVGILRAGRLVEVATLNDLRRIGATKVEIVVDGLLPTLDDVPGVSAVETVAGNPGAVRVTVTGSPGPLLQRLAGVPVVRLRTEEPSLEEIFLTYY